MKKLLVLFTVTTLLLGFQNCAPTMNFNPAEGSAEAFSKAIQEGDGNQVAPVVIVDENNGEIIGVDESAPVDDIAQDDEQQEEVIEEEQIVDNEEEQVEEVVAPISDELACDVSKVTVKFKASFLFIGEYTSDKQNSDKVDVRKIVVDLASGVADYSNPVQLKRSCTLDAASVAELKSFACECIANSSAPNCDNYSKKLSQDLLKNLKRLDDCSKTEGEAEEGIAQEDAAQKVAKK